MTTTVLLTDVASTRNQLTAAANAATQSGTPCVGSYRVTLLRKLSSSQKTIVAYKRR